ncbi:hypothetical protein LTR04_001787 [Oleoguttula sp. CCFEE 6159]|nr:hypothetical protein LTR04_001787 [Oleoguttula sp. CCFEE 6159]
MVDIGIKPTTRRAAVAISRLHFSNPTAASLIATNSLKKGDVLSVARIAGIMAAKATSTLIPLCHPLAITHLSVTCVLRHELGPFGGVAVEARVECQGPTGVEMEALTAASVAALTVYDMCKAVDRGMEVRLAKVVLKEGGRSGSWRDEAYWAKEPRRGDGKGQ